MKKKKILIADDDRQIRRALRARLTDWGYDVVESSDGLGVISQTTRVGVDAVILDHEMPLGNGRDIAHLIRNETVVPIVFLSGHDREEFHDAVHTLPNVYFFSKPLEAERLQQLLQSCVGAGCVDKVCA